MRICAYANIRTDHVMLPRNNDDNEKNPPPLNNNSELWVAVVEHSVTGLKSHLVNVFLVEFR